MNSKNDFHLSFFEETFSAIPALFFATLLFLQFLFPLSLHASETNSDPIKAKVGFFVTSLHDFSLTNNDYEIISWVWFLSNNKEYDPFQSTEVTNAKTFSKDSNGTEEVGDLFWHSMKFHARMKHDWDISNYPFDIQRLEIDIEDIDLDATGLQYVPDKENSKLDSDLKLQGWDVLEVDVGVKNKVYRTSYGYPDSLEKWDYSRATLFITLQRHGERLLFDNLIGTYIAFIFVFLMFSLPTSEMKSKFAFLSASIFASIGNKYIINSKLPTTTSITLIDKIQWLTFGCIAMSAIMAIIIAHNVKKPGEKRVMRMNHIVQIVMIVVYVGLNVIWIAKVV